MRTALTVHYKYREAENVARNLPPLASEVGMTEFEERLALFKELREIWGTGAILHRVDSWQTEGEYTNIIWDVSIFISRTLSIQVMLGALAVLKQP